MHERREYSPRLCGDMNQGIIIGQYADPIFIPGSLRLTPNNLLEMTRGKSLPLTLSSGAGDLKLTALYSECTQRKAALLICIVLTKSIRVTI